jgi:hypothetical protein
MGAARSSRSNWAVGLLVTVMVLCIPLWFPVAMLLAVFDKRTIRKAAKRFACVSCGNILGIEALTRADEAWSEQMRELQGQHSDVIFRIVRTLHAICACGTRYTFREKERTFAVEEQSPAVLS